MTANSDFDNYLARLHAERVGAYNTQKNIPDIPVEGDDGEIADACLALAEHLDNVTREFVDYVCRAAIGIKENGVEAAIESFREEAWEILADYITAGLRKKADALNSRGDTNAEHRTYRVIDGVGW